MSKRSVLLTLLFLFLILVFSLVFVAYFTQQNKTFAPTQITQPTVTSVPQVTVPVVSRLEGAIVELTQGAMSIQTAEKIKITIPFTSSTTVQKAVVQPGGVTTFTDTTILQLSIGQEVQVFRSPNAPEVLKIIILK